MQSVAQIAPVPQRNRKKPKKTGRSGIFPRGPFDFCGSGGKSAPEQGYMYESSLNPAGGGGG
jgi:hypothetical protein